MDRSLREKIFFSNDSILFILFFSYLCSVAQLCPALCDPMDCSLPGSAVHEIFQARIPEWVAISYSV